MDMRYQIKDEIGIVASFVFFGDAQLFLIACKKANWNGGYRLFDATTGNFISEAA